MNVTPTFLNLPDAGPDSADVILLPLPFEGTVSYGRGTSGGPAAILTASAQIELWDEEVDFDLDRLAYHSAPPVLPNENEQPGEYLERVFTAAARLQHNDRLIVGVGGEHSVTSSLVRAAAGSEGLSGVTIVQVDAHADLRNEFEGTKHSHACVLRRIVDRGASVIAIGIRSADRAEMEFGRSTGRCTTYFAHHLAGDLDVEQNLLGQLKHVTGKVYLTIDIDALDVMYSPATGTPQPGGLSWWQTLRYLRALLIENRNCMIIGCDIVETVPQHGTVVNEITAARLLCKMLAYVYGNGARD